MKYLFSTFSGYGHINPILALASELVRRGHSVHWLCGPRFKDYIVATGAKFLPWKDASCDNDLTPICPDPDTTGMEASVTFARTLWVDPMPGQIREYRRAYGEHRFDALVVDIVALAASVFAKESGIPYITIATNPRTICDHADTSVAERESVPLCDMWGSPAFMQGFTPVVNHTRATMGLDALSPSFHLLDAITSPYLHLMQTTASFEDIDKVKGPHMHFVGPMKPFTTGKFDPPSWWTKLTDRRRFIVHVTQGTYTMDAAALVEPTIRALANEDCLVIATTPEFKADMFSTENLPLNAHVEPYISHDQLLPYVDVMITNAGYNGTTTALSHGVPLICAGRSEDKADVSRLVAKTGAGIDLDTSKPSIEAIRAAVRLLRGTNTYKEQAERIQKDFQQHDSVTESCDLIEQLLDM
ncbi:MAG: hypothetical protein Q9219_005884 [cf. Caloplaca sp. 3 TL-2023]